MTNDTNDLVTDEDKKTSLTLHKKNNGIYRRNGVSE
jgi:hypothetical protein